MYHVRKILGNDRYVVTDPDSVQIADKRFTHLTKRKFGVSVMTGVALARKTMSRRWVESKTLLMSLACLEGSSG